jgi:hypothetical protein
MTLSITSDSDTKYFKISKAYIDELIEDVGYKIWIRAINDDKALIEVENTNKD